MTDTPLIYLVAGEASGDFLGAQLMASLQEKSGGKLRFAGVGGPRMEAEGLTSLFPFHELSIMGFIEILPHLPRLLRRFRQTRKDIEQRRPAMVITIDAPGFNFPLMRKVRKKLGDSITLLHYVAPTVWAYRPERAQKIAALYDHLLLLLPFEKPYFDRAGLPATFVGHPVIWEPVEEESGKAFRDRHGILPTTKLLCMLPGSRKGELVRHLPIFREVTERLARSIPDLTVTMVLGKHLLPIAEPMVEDWPVRLVLVEGESEKAGAFAASDAALSKSGTVTLEVARAGVPMVVTYRVSDYSAKKLRKMIQVPYVSLINLILDAPVIPELLQEDCTPAKLTDALRLLLKTRAAGEAQRIAVRPALQAMGLGAERSPSDHAAEVVLDLLSRRG